MSHARRRSRARLALLMITSVGLITLDVRHATAVESLRRVVSTSLAPLQGVTESAVGPVRHAWQGVTGRDDLRAENARLRAALDDAQGRVLQARISDDLLAGMLAAEDLPWAGGASRTLARVVGGRRSNFSRSIEIDKGSRAGIRVGMPVVVGAGLVGRVQAIRASSSVVQLVTDPDIRVGVKVVPNGPFGTARGVGDARRLDVDTSVEPEKAPHDGLVVTAGGSDSPYPPALPVGTIRGSRPASNRLTADLDVEPFTDLDHLDFVTVLLWHDGG